MLCVKYHYKNKNKTERNMKIYQTDSGNTDFDENFV